MRKEDRLLRLDIHRQSGRRQEVVERVVLASKVGAPAVGKVYYRVAEGRRVCAALAQGRDGNGQLDISPPVHAHS